MKRNALVSSIVVIALCISLIAGSTYALFTADASVDIEINSGKAEITASLTTPILYSAEPDANGEEFDENGRPYTYVERPADTFYNGGTAKLNGSIIELKNVTPGDKIVFKLGGTNIGEIALQYRYRIECLEGYELMSGFVMTVEGKEYASMASYVSEWNTLASQASIDKIASDTEDGVALALELPISAGNEFQNLSATIRVTVEAVQQNADTLDENGKNLASVKYITTVDDSTELATKLASDEYLHIFVDDNINETLYVDFDMKDKTIDANGKNISLSFGSGDKTAPTTLKNVVITGIADTADETPAVIITSSVKGDITIADSVLYSGSKAPYGAIAANGSNQQTDVTVKNCKMFTGTGEVDANGKPVSVKERGIYLTDVNNLTVRDCEFVGFATWPVMVNGTVNGNVVITGCTFRSCMGILKTSIGGSAPGQTGTLNGNLTFANNTMVDCTLNYCSSLKIDCYISAKNVYGTLTFTNNTMNGVVVTPDDMLGIKLVTP